MRTLIAVCLYAPALPAGAQQYVIMASEYDSTTQHVLQGVNFFDSTDAIIETVADPARAGLLFSKFTFDGEQWVVLSQLEDSLETQFVTSDVRPTALIKEVWKDKMEVTDLAFGQGQWIVYAKSNTGVSQVLAHTTDFNHVPELIKDYWSKGYIVTETCYGQGAWALIFSKPETEDHALNNVEQVYSTISGAYADVQAKVEARWGQGYPIGHISTNGSLWLIIGTRLPHIVSQQIVLAKNREELLEAMYKARQQELRVTELVAVE